MMEEIFELTLDQINEDGSFYCPRCRQLIDPNDHSDKTYKIIDNEPPKENQVNLTVQCGQCGSRIKLHLVETDT